MVHFSLGRRRADTAQAAAPAGVPVAAPTAAAAAPAASSSSSPGDRRRRFRKKKRSSRDSYDKDDEEENDRKRSSCGLEMSDNDFLETSAAAAASADSPYSSGRLDWRRGQQQQQQDEVDPRRFEARRKKEERRRKVSRTSCRQQQQQQDQMINPPPPPHPSSSRGGGGGGGGGSFSAGGISLAPSDADVETGSQRSKKSRRQPARFSLRRLFYGNPLLAQPFLQSTAAAVGNPGSSRSFSGLAPPPPRPHHSSGRQRRRHRGGSSSRFEGDSFSSSWRDNMSAGAGSQQGVTTVGPDGRVFRECSLCLLSVPIDRFPLLLNCPHLFCSECLRSYVRIEVQEGRANIRCPQCTEQMHPNDIETLINSSNEKNSQHLLRLYEQLMLRRILATDPDTRWCPGPNCTYAVIATGCASCPMLCCQRPGCGYYFCYHCKAEWHPNQTCDAARLRRGEGSVLAAAAAAASGGAASGASAAGGGGAGHDGASSNAGGSTAGSSVKVCPRCSVLIVKMEDGSCNHMTCAVCGAEFCWLCMKEISDLHYLSPSGCTFWGKKPWSRKKKLLWQLGTLVGAPVGIALLASISVPAMIIGIPVWVSRKLHARFANSTRCRRNAAIAGGVVLSAIVSPVLAALAVGVGVPILLAYVYGVVPISLCRSEGCGVSTDGAGGVRIDVDEEDDDMPYTRIANGSDGVSVHGGSQVGNPSIGEVSLGASLSLGSACHLGGHDNKGGGGGAVSNSSVANLLLGSVRGGGGRSSSSGGAGGSREDGLEGCSDRENASVTAMAGTSRTVSLASSYVANYGSASIREGTAAAAAAPPLVGAAAAAPAFFRSTDSASIHTNVSATTQGGGSSTIGGGGHLMRLEVGADVHSSSHNRKKFSLSSDRLEDGLETGSLGGRSTATAASAGTTAAAEAALLRSDNDGAASTRALAGSIVYKMTGGDNQSVGSCRSGHAIGGASYGGGGMSGGAPGAAPGAGAVSVCGNGGGASADEISLRSLPGNHSGFSLAPSGATASNASHPAHQRSLSPVSNMSGDELSVSASRRSTRRRPYLDKQLSENSSLLSAEVGEASCACAADAVSVSERVRFDDNVSFIDEEAAAVTGAAAVPEVHKSSLSDSSSSSRRRSVREETAEELRRDSTQGHDNVTRLRVGDDDDCEEGQEKATVV